MQPLTLVISDPPHPDVDLADAAHALGLPPRDAQPKIEFGAPEVLMSSGFGRANEFAEKVSQAGMNVVTIEGNALVGIPWPSPVSSFEFADAVFIGRFEGDTTVELPYDIPVLGIFCEPPEGFPEHGPPEAVARNLAGQPGFDPGLALAEAIQWMSILDLFFMRDGALQRITIARDFTDFEGLGDAVTPSATENVRATVAAFSSRFTRIEIDKRLAGVRPRQRFVTGEAGFDLDLRKLFSFGTLLLRQALDEISPELRDLPQYELGSRLAWVMRRR